MNQRAAVGSEGRSALQRPQTIADEKPAGSQESPGQERRRTGLPTGPWGIRDALTALALAIVAILSIHYGAALLPTPSSVTSPLCTLILEICLFSLALAFSVRKYNISTGSFGFRPYRRREDRRLTLLGALGMLTCLVLWQAMAVRLHVIALHAAPNLGTSSFASPVAIVILGFTVCAVAPIAEETFFRGFLFRALLNKQVELRLGHRTLRFFSGFWPALAISGSFFAGAHVQVALFLPFLAISAVLAWLFWRSGSLWPAIFAHGAFNSIGFALALRAHFP